MRMRASPRDKVSNHTVLCGYPGSRSLDWIANDIQDDLLLRAKKLAADTGRPLRAVVEESLRQALALAEEPAAYKLQDLSVGDRDADDPMERLSWQDLRAEIYGQSELPPK